MNWKIVLPIGIVVLLLVTFFYTRGSLKSSPLIPAPSQQAQDQAVTTQNVDQALTQTDQAVDTTTRQLDQDLQSLDQTDNSQDNLNNL